MPGSPSAVVQLVGCAAAAAACKTSKTRKGELRTMFSARRRLFHSAASEEQNKTASKDSTRVSRKNMLRHSYAGGLGPTPGYVGYGGGERVGVGIDSGRVSSAPIVDLPAARGKPGNVGPAIPPTYISSWAANAAARSSSSSSSRSSAAASSSDRSAPRSEAPLLVTSSSESYGSKPANVSDVAFRRRLAWDLSKEKDRQRLKANRAAKQRNRRRRRSTGLAPPSPIFAPKGDPSSGSGFREEPRKRAELPTSASATFYSLPRRFFADNGESCGGDSEEWEDDEDGTEGKGVGGHGGKDDRVGDGKRRNRQTTRAKSGKGRKTRSPRKKTKTRTKTKTTRSPRKRRAERSKGGRRDDSGDERDTERDHDYYSRDERDSRVYRHDDRWDDDVTYHRALERENRLRAIRRAQQARQGQHWETGDFRSYNKLHPRYVVRY